ncbi:unnamed protein product [Closterium sp. NIES-53]
MTSLRRSGGSGDSSGGSSRSGGGRTSSCCGSVRWGVSGGGQMQLQRNPRESLPPQQLRELYASRSGGGSSGSSGSRCADVQLAVSRDGLAQRQRRPRETLTPQQLREWYGQRGASRSSARCPYVIRTGASESALPGTTPVEALHIFTLDSDASRCFFRDSTTLTPLSAPVPVRLADPSGGPNLAQSSTVLLCLAVPSSSLSGLHLPSFSTNLGCKRYFMLVVDDYTRYTTVFPLRSKGKVPDVLIPWIRAVRLQLCKRFREDLPVLRLHSDRGGEFSSDLLRDFCPPHWLSHGGRSYLHDSCTRLWSGDARAGDSTTGDTGAGCAGVSVVAGGTGGAAAAGPEGARTKGTGAAGTGGAGAGGVVSGGTCAGGTVRPRPYFVPLLQQVLGVPSSTGLTPPLLCPPPDLSEPLLQQASPVPAPSPYTEQTGGLTERHEPVSRPAFLVRTIRRVPRPQSDRARAASPTVSCLLTTIVNGPSFESTAAFALVAELVDFAAACRLHYATALIAESGSASPLSVGGECALGTDVLEDRQEDFECLAAAVPPFASMLLAPEGDPNALDIPTSCSYAEAITGPYSSQWQAAMVAEMASWKSIGTYVNAVPPSRVNIVDGMWIFRVKRPTGSPPAFQARYVARGFSQRQGWSLRRPVYGLCQAPREWHDTLRTILVALGFIPSTADPSQFLRADTSLPPFYVLVYVDDLVFTTADTEALTLVKSELQKRHICTDLGPSALPLPVLLATAHSSVYRPLALSSTFARVLRCAWGSCLEDGVQLSSLATQTLLELTTWLRSGRHRVTPSASVLALFPSGLPAYNKAMIALYPEHRQEHRTKHIAPRYFLARELQQRGQLRLAYVATRANTADIFTKALPPGDHQRFSTVLGLLALRS